MKIRKVTPDNLGKATAMLRQAFPNTTNEVQLVENFHKNKTAIHEWVCIHVNTVIAYIAFSNAYNDSDACGLHLALLAVKPEFQKQGIGSELLRFALRQDFIKTTTLFVIGNPGFFQKFGFEPCAIPVCPFEKKKGQFLSIRNKFTNQFTVGYDPAFNIEKKLKKIRKS